MPGLFIAALFGLGLLFIFDALVRPGAHIDLRAPLRRLGPAAISGAIVALVATIATGWPIAVVAGAALGAAGPGVVRRSREEKERIARREALADLSSRLRDAIRAGIGLSDALAQAAANPPPAIASDLRRLASDARVSGLAAAAASFSERMHDPAAELLASALGLADRLGSRNLSDVLDALAEATTAQAATVREARARQTRARMSARIVAAVPLLLLLAIRRANPAYLAPFGTAAGQAVLALAVVLVVAGYRWMKRAARIEGEAT
jgi:Flp pilus assembly protein TadB